uniref:Uncharacterized protein n=1 Tax=Arundo donax TaxID=35708 RepID=A0A0A9BZF2_ARUDO
MCIAIYSKKLCEISPPKKINPRVKSTFILDMKGGTSTRL